MLFSYQGSSAFAERRRRDLNPCAAVNDLLPFQGSPFGQLGYFSKIVDVIIDIRLPSSLLIKLSGESGIRTHAPLRTNGFQDRLVMTTSISLHSDGEHSTASVKDCQALFYTFLSHVISQAETLTILTLFQISVKHKKHFFSIIYSKFFNRFLLTQLIYTQHPTYTPMQVPIST